MKLTRMLSACGALALLALAGCGPSEPASTGGPVSVRRLTQEQYRNVIADVFGTTVKVGGRFEPEVRDGGLLALGTSKVSVTAAGLEQYDTLARDVAGQVVSPEHRGTLIGCKPADEKAADDACAGQFLAKAGRLLYRRPLSKDELALQVKVANESAGKLGGFYPGLQMSLAGMLVSPPFLFREENAVAAKGGQQLDAWSKASRISFLLWNTGPDDTLLTAAEKGELDSQKGLEKQVDRMLNSPRVEQGVRAFFADMLGFDGFATLAKDPQIFPKFSSSVTVDAQEQTLRTITDHLLTQKADYRDLFTSRKTFLTPVLASIYRVPVVGDEGWVAYEFPKGDPRGGLLAQVSFVALHSHPGRSSPTLRGKALREVLLCQKVPDPPGNVDFKFVQDTNNPDFKTARARLTQHSQDATCAGCHKIMDPLGLAMENFDSSGGFRTTENGAPIDGSGELDGVKFTDANGLGQAVHDSPALTNCIVNRVYGYAAGHLAGKAEADYIAYLEKGFASSGHRFPDLLRRIAVSETFYRIAPAEPAKPTTAEATTNTKQESGS